MADPAIEFTNVSNLNAEAIGEPGQRTFRILADSGTSSATIWLEKEQLLQLALGVKQLLATLPSSEAVANASVGLREAPEASRLDFKVGKLVLGHDARVGRFLIDAHDLETGDEEPATVRVWGERSQVSSFADEALKVCAAGRPLCPLCGGPLDPEGHSCPRANGHSGMPLTR